MMRVIENGGNIMRLNAPKQITWWIALIIGAIGIIVRFVIVPVISPYAFWFVVVALVLLLLSTHLKGL